MWFLKFLLLLCSFCCITPCGLCEKHNKSKSLDLGDDKYDMILTDGINLPTLKTNDDPKKLRQEIAKASIQTPRIKTNQMLSEVSILKGDISEAVKKSGNTPVMSDSLLKMISEGANKIEVKVGSSADSEENPAIPNIPGEIDPNTIHSLASRFLDQTNQNSFTDKFDIKSHIVNDPNKSNLYREKLNITSVEEDLTFKFKLKSYAEEWKSVNHNGKIVLIGKTSHSIVTFLEGSNDTFEFSQEIEIENNTKVKSSLEAFEMWDDFVGDKKDFIVVSANNVLEWYELRSEKIVNFWRWSITRTILKVIHFLFDNNHVILLSTIDNKNQSSVELFEFDVYTEQFWLVQFLTLENPATSIAPLDTGKDFILAIVQKSKVSIFRYQYNKHERGKFEHYDDIPANSVEVVSGFRIGGYSYIAIGGETPQIMRYHKGKFYSQTILSQTFGVVEEFLPIPVQIQRDDLILLVQHRLFFDTHSVAVLEALIWNGIAFDTAHAVPCKTLEPNSQGLSCMLDVDRDVGMKGIAYIKKGKSLSILMPRNNAHSGLYKIFYEIVGIDESINKEIEELKKSYSIIRKMLEYEDSVRKEAEEVLVTAFDPYAEHRIANIPEITYLHADFLEIEDEVFLEDSVIEFLDSSWTKHDFQINLDLIEKTIEEGEMKLVQLNEELTNLIRKNRAADNPPRASASVHHIGTYQYNGRLDLSTIHLLTTPAPQFPKDHIRRPRQSEFDIPETVTLNNLNANELIFETINGIPAEELLFSDNGFLDLSSDTVTFDSLEVKNVEMIEDGLVNGINLQKEVLCLDSGTNLDKLVFENIQVTDNLQVNNLNNISVDLKTLQDLSIENEGKGANVTSKITTVKGNIHVQNINGVPWSKFKKNLVPKHKTGSLETIEVLGDVIVRDAGRLFVDNVNGLSFPGEYVRQSGPTETIITGKKVFLESLITNNIDCNGTIDNISTFDTITLDQPQTIQSNMIFNSLEVTERLEVNGTISGRNLEDFLANPTLQETREIQAACHFNNLIVDGPIIIENYLNDVKLEEALTDVVYDNEAATEINSKKVFQNVEFIGGLTINSGFINNHRLDNIMLTDKEQQVNLKFIKGDLLFSKLNLGGAFDGVNVTDLEFNSVRTFGDQVTECEIDFQNRNLFIEAESAHIKDSLNSKPISEYLNNQNIMLDDAVVFDKLAVENLQCSGDIFGSGNLNDIILDNFNEDRLSKSKEQTILQPCQVKNLIVTDKFKTEFINNRNVSNFKRYIENIKNYESLIFAGNGIKDLFIHGDITVNNLNKHNFQFILENAIWMDKSNEIFNEIEFSDKVMIDGSLTVRGFVNNIPFMEFLNNLVDRNESPIVIDGIKRFKSHLTVQENVEVLTFNGIKFENILMKDDEVILENLKINGSLMVNNLYVEGNFNDIPISTITSTYSYDPATFTHIIKDNVNFENSVNFNCLNTPTFNNLKISDTFNDFIYTNQDNIIIKNPKIFQNNVKFENGIHTKTFNDLNLEFLKNLVMVNEKDQVDIDGSVVFESSVKAKGVGTKDLVSRFVSGCDPVEWRDSGWMIDRDAVIPGDFHVSGAVFKPSTLTVTNLNLKPMQSLIQLHKDQVFDCQLIVDNLIVKAPLILLGKYNGINLEFERNETVMKFGEDQEIYAITEFQGATVLNSLKSDDRINGVYLDNIVKLKSDVVLESPVSFQKLSAQNLYTNDFVNGIDFNKWVESTVMARGKDKQEIYGNWTIRKAKLRKDIVGNGLINNLNYKQVQTNLESNLNKIQAAVQDYSSNWRKLCYSMQSFANKSLDNVHIIKYFEQSFILKENSKIFSIFPFATKTDNFLIVNTGCSSNLYVWIPQEENFKYLQEVPTGVVHNWLAVKDKNYDVFLITSTKSSLESCEKSGTNVWKIANYVPLHVFKLPVTEEIVELKESYEPGQFVVLTESDKVKEFNVFGGQINEWSLPTSVEQYSFVSYDFGFGLALHNGNALVRLTPRSQIARKRKRESDILRVKTFKNESNVNYNPSAVPQSPIINVKPYQEMGGDLKIKKENIGFYNEFSPAHIPLSEMVDENVKQHNDYLQKMQKNKIAFNATSPDAAISLFSLPKIPGVSLNSKVSNETEPNLGQLPQLPQFKIPNVFENFTFAPNWFSQPKIETTTHKEVDLDKLAADVEDFMESESAKTLFGLIERNENSTDLSTKHETRNKSTNARVPSSSSKKITTKVSSTQIPIIAEELETPTVGKILKNESPNKVDLDSEKSIDVFGGTTEDPLTDQITILKSESSSIGENTEDETNIFVPVQNNPEIYLNQENLNFDYNDIEATSIPPEIALEPEEEAKSDSESNDSNIEKIPVTEKMDLIKEETKSPEERDEKLTEVSENNDLKLVKVPVTEKMMTLDDLINEESQNRKENVQNLQRPLNIPLTPRIIMDKSDINVSLENEVIHTRTTVAPKTHEVKVPMTPDNIDPIESSRQIETFQAKSNPQRFEESVVGLPIPLGSIITTNNPYLPEKGTGEVLVLYVGPSGHKRKLYAVSTTKQMRIRGSHDMIDIYEDIVDGKLYQTLPCSQPSNLNVLHFRDETFLVFLEGYFRVQIYIYRGIQGFIPHTNFRLPTFASHLTTISLPLALRYKCDARYLAVTLENEIMFIETKISGNCGIDPEFSCEN